MSGDVTLANWRTAPFNKSAFHHVREIVPTAVIEHDPGNVWTMPNAPRSLKSFGLRMRDGATLSLEDMLEATASDGLVVLFNGDVVFEDYRNGMTPTSPHIIMSASKSVTGLTAGVLADKGVLDTQALVSHYVPESATSPFANATIRNLLDMRTGVRLDERQLADYAAATGWESVADGTPSDMHAFFSRLSGPPATHNGAFAYISANTDLLGWAIERAAGTTFASLLSALLWKPMGAEAAAYITTDAKGAPRCTGGLCATVRDFARIGQLMVDGGRRGTVQIIPSALIEDIAEGGDHQAWRTGEFAAGFSGATIRYRSGWYVVDDAPKHVFAMGIHGQNLFVDRVNKLVIAKVSSQANALDYNAIALTHRAVGEIRRCLLDR